MIRSSETFSIEALTQLLLRKPYKKRIKLNVYTKRITLSRDTMNKISKIEEFEKSKLEKSEELNTNFLDKIQTTKKQFRQPGNSENTVFQKIGVLPHFNLVINATIMFILMAMLSFEARRF